MEAQTSEVRAITADEAFPLRHRVLRPHRPPEHSRYNSDNIPGTFHLGVFDADEIVGVASFTPERHLDFSDPVQYILRGMAVNPVRQGSGYGKRLLAAGIAELRMLECNLLWLKAREVAVPFYLSCGFLPHGEWYDTPHSGPHLEMFQRL